MTGSNDASRPTAGELARTLIGELSHQELPVLSVVEELYFENATTRGRVTHSVVARSRRQTPSSFGDGARSLVVQTVLVVVNAVATGRLGDPARPAVPRGWWARRRLARQLGSRSAAAGAATPMPPMSAARAEQVRVEVKAIALNAGLAEPDAARLADLLWSAVVTRD